MDLKLKSEGRSMISRTGQHCYVKNRLLLKENEALSLRESGHHNSLNRVARIAKARRHRPSAAPDSPASI